MATPLLPAATASDPGSGTTNAVPVSLNTVPSELVPPPLVVPRGARPVRQDTAVYRRAGHRQVTHRVQHLVPDEFVR